MKNSNATVCFVVCYLSPHHCFVNVVGFILGGVDRWQV